MLAILVGGLLGHETITPWIIGGMACTLVGVALLRTGSVRQPGTESPEPRTELKEVEAAQEPRAATKLPSRC